MLFLSEDVYLKKDLYTAYLKIYLCRIQAGQHINSEVVFQKKGFSEGRFLRNQQYHATYSLAKKEESLFVRDFFMEHHPRKREIYYYIYPNGYYPFGDTFRSCILERRFLNIPYMVIQR